MPRLDIGFRANPDSLVAYDRGTLQRIGSVEFKLTDNACYLDNISVVPEVRRQGIATQLVQEMLSHVELPYEKVYWRAVGGLGKSLKRSIDRKNKVVS